MGMGMQQLGSSAKGAVGEVSTKIEAADKQRQLVLFEGVVARLGHNYGGDAGGGTQNGGVKRLPHS